MEKKKLISLSIIIASETSRKTNRANLVKQRFLVAPIFCNYVQRLQDYIVDPCYLRILDLRTCLLTKFVTPSQYLWCCHVHAQTSAEQWRICVTWCTCSRLKAMMPCLGSPLILSTSTLFTVYLVPSFSDSCTFCWWFHCLDDPPTAVLSAT